MKLIYAIVQNDDSKQLIREFNRRRISVTRISSTGGFLHSGNSTLMIGVEADRLDEALDVIKEKSSTRKEYMVVPSAVPGYIDNAAAPVQVTLGGATVFVVNVDHFYRF